ncbi:hypothetical protein, variant [Verruconis gallopava]|uniref:Phospholipid/glycerol acyltransferase domain-containing protein n=1 Tax=Verruconis gallopava TaxID=253628 RepID=A0A0D1XJ98_9PEZI|nr:uncharacterized protein PV09_06193 [Verruconis gallopava]XP_016212240.1 hypothetical protein, variant [Verruconis gallopava]KIW02370.1 hypothetical protein PV09_06193 [Verruconis gallopava]KIW02371.1 hypothetical protein, variant [Verruconis gallopava]
MEKYGQYRDKGSGIAPFFPIAPTPSGIYLPLHVFLFCVRVPLLFAFSITYFVLFSWLPVNSLVKKAALWTMLGIPGIWWVDLQIDGVRRGSLAQHQHRLPKPGTVIASSFTSPIDCLYLAAIFDPVFTASYPNTRLVEQISLFHAIVRALLGPQLAPAKTAKLVSLATLLKENPDSSIVVLPECTTSNGRAILPFSPSLLTTPPKTKIFPINLRYTPADITTPIPGAYLTFLWDLCSRPTHCIRVRIAEAVYNTAPDAKPVAARSNSYETSFFDEMQAGSTLSSSDTLVSSNGDELSHEERKVLDRVAEDLARLGRVKRVGLGVAEKIDFMKVWSKTRKIY